ncbi:MAG: Na/Pi cotransporter family protein [bacterium]|nr:Na/Pi cotransporter family protein [bacterium]
MLSLASAPEWLALATGLLGGLALFLYGLELMTKALKAVAGHRLRTLLAQLTVNRVAGVFSGALVTAIIQSSSITTVLVVSFISSGLMTLSQSVGVILGANIGTTVTAQIIAFKVTKLSMAMIAAGFTVSFLSKKGSLRQHGLGALGLGLVFLGMTLMSDAMAPLRDFPPFLEWMGRMEHPALAILAAALFTGLVQSSSATTAVVIAMASQGLIGLPTGIALIMGANVGTCVTALLAAIGKPREAVRASLVHVLFNLLGVALWVGLIDWLASAVVNISPSSPELSGAARLAADTPRQIANAHTAFNTINALIFLPFASLLAAAAERLIPDRPLAQEDEIRAQLDEDLLDTPVLAFDQARLEIVRIGEKSIQMLDAVLPAMLRGDEADLSKVEEIDRGIDRLHRDVVEYLALASQRPLIDGETVTLIELVSVCNAFENLADVIESDLVRRGRERLSAEIEISAETTRVIGELHAQVAAAVRIAMAAFGASDPALASQVLEQKATLNTLLAKATTHQVGRLAASDSHRSHAYAVESDMIEGLQRVFYYAKRIAQRVLEASNPDDA